jgi:hypothetical protein
MKIEILSAAQAGILLRASTLLFEGAATSSIAILLFAGLRPSELADLKPGDVKADRIRVTGGKMRRKLKRTVDIPHVLKRWLKAYPFERRPGGWVYKSRKIRSFVDHPNWVSDILRHTSISFQLERDQNVERVAWNNGTSVNMIEQHYREGVESRNEVKRFWELDPEAVAKVKLPDSKAKIPTKLPVQWPSNAELKKLVWKKPLVHVGKDLGVSDNAVRKRCKKFEIELPRNGYWLKKQRDLER